MTTQHGYPPVRSSPKSWVPLSLPGGRESVLSLTTTTTTFPDLGLPGREAPPPSPLSSPRWVVSLGGLPGLPRSSRTLSLDMAFRREKVRVGTLQPGPLCPDPCTAAWSLGSVTSRKHLQGRLWVSPGPTLPSPPQDDFPSTPCPTPDWEGSDTGGLGPQSSPV